MALSNYASLVRNRRIRQIELLAFLTRVPIWAGNVVAVLFVVGHLHRSYAAAGIAGMVSALALAVSGPWRGRALDRLGLRRALVPTIVAETVCWSLAPWVSFWPFLVLVAVANLLAVPTFSIVRQVLIGAVPDGQRTAALAMDSVTTEISYMVGPLLGVLAATYLPLPLALLVCMLVGTAGGVLLWIANPPLRHDVEDAGEPKPSRSSWFSPAVVAVLLITATATLILTTEDLGSVAAMRFWHHTGSLGWVLSLWGLGSAIGGIVYGALPKHPPAAVILVPLGLSTALVPLAQDRLSYAALLFVSGLFCAPTITATIDDLSRLVPASVRGEAMGWHGSALTLGSALGGPLIGTAIDAGGWSRGLLVGGLTGLAISLVGLAFRRRRLALSQSA